MTYALSWPLQQGLYHLFCANTLCVEHFGHRIYDAPPPLAMPDSCHLNRDRLGEPTAFS